MIKEKLTQYIEDTIKEVQFIKEIKSLFAVEILLIGL